MTTKCEMQILLLKMAVTIREIEQSGSASVWRVATKDSFHMTLMDYSSSNTFEIRTISVSDCKHTTQMSIFFILIYRSLRNEKQN